jgi:two-component system chemotaxis response regulator CheY
MHAAALRRGRMTDEFISLKAMIVSGAAGDRELVRRAMAGASIPVIVTEVEAAGDATAALKALAGDTYDVVLFDSAMPAFARQTLIAAVRGEPDRPLAVAIGDAPGIDVDCALSKPIEQQQAASLIENCIAVRLPKRVLVVDDSAAVRSVIQKVLKASRFRITAEEADSHASAVEQVKRGAFDVVMLDCQLSGQDGFETLAELRQIRPDARVLMITEKHDTAMAERARGGGAAYLLAKPFFAKDIDTAFSRLFRLGHLRWD